jgi:hypothetical protein
MSLLVFLTIHKDFIDSSDPSAKRERSREADGEEEEDTEEENSVTD